MKVSVIIPVYNVAQYIAKCAESLFEQTLGEIEYIFVNDCSTDDSMLILDEVIRKYPSRKNNIKIINHEQNKGLPFARKTGLSIATGDYVAHCDSDDYVDKDMYRIMYETAVTGNFDIVICDHYLIDGTKKIYVEQIIKPKTIVSDLISEKISCCVWNKLIKHSIYKENDIIYPIYNMGEDFAIMTQLSFYCKRIKHISRPLYFYRKSLTSITNTVSETACINRCLQLRTNFEIVLSFLKKKHVLKLYKNDIIIRKYIVRSTLLPIISVKGIYLMWYNTYPELNKKMLFVKIPLKYKIIFFVTMCGLYPIYHKLVK